MFVFKNEKHSILELQKNPNLLETVDNDFMRVIPNDLHIPGGRSSNEAYELSKRVRDYYLGAQPVSENTMDEMINV